MKSKCGCEIPITVDAASYPSVDEMRWVRNGIDSITDALLWGCEDAKRQAYICENIKSGTVPYAPHNLPAAVVANKVASSSTASSGYCASDQIARAANNFSSAAP